MSLLKFDLGLIILSAFGLSICKLLLCHLKVVGLTLLNIHTNMIIIGKATSYKNIDIHS